MTTTPRFAVAAAVNDDTVLQQCLAASPDIAAGALPLRTYENYPSAAIAYNRAMAQAGADYLILAHQDVYLPRGFLARLAAGLAELDRIANWGVAGVIGANSQGIVQGKVWSTGRGRVFGGQGAPLANVTMLDEMILVVKPGTTPAFDEQLPGFHLYAADIIQIAEAAGLSTWAVDAPAIHHSRPVTNLGGSYSEAWHFMRRKWRDRLPIPNLVCPVTASRLTLLKKDLRLRFQNRGRLRRGDAPAEEPAAIAARLGFDAD